MALRRKEPAEFVEWSQSAILQRLKQILSQIGAPSTSTKAVTDAQVVERLDQVILQMEKLNTQLALITENDIELGEHG